jgi:ParB/RepB/Spo0J family partition protein
MATATQTTSTVALARAELRNIPLSRVRVAEGFNPRGEVTEDAELQALAETMRHSGCLQPIRVQTTSDGDYQLVAGERRYRAAALAALTEIPASVLPASTGSDAEQLELLVEAMIENELRSDLDTVQRARGYQAMLDRGLSIRGAAERLGGKVKRVSRERRIKEHLPILALPEQLQPLVAAQTIPLFAVKTLLELAAIHEELAHAAVHAASHDEEAETAYSWQEVIENPIEIALRYMEQPPDGVYTTRAAYPVEQFTLSEKTQKDLAAYSTLTDGGQISYIRFAGELVEQAKLLGSVHDAGWFSLIVGTDVADQLAADYIAAALKDERSRQRRERKNATSDPQDSPTGTEDPAATTPPAKQESEAERVQRETNEATAKRTEQQQRRDQAITFNLELGLLAFKHLPKLKVDERLLRVLASVDVGGSLRKISTRGARLALPGWVTQSLQRNQKTKTSYLDTWDAERKALAFLSGAESAGEIAGRAFTLIALASLANEDAVAQSSRSYYELEFEGAWAKQAARDLNAIVRERIKEGQLPALDQLLAKRITAGEADAEREATAEQALAKVEDASQRVADLSQEELSQLESDAQIAYGTFDPRRQDIRRGVKAERERRNQAPSGDQHDPQPAPAEASA